MRDELTAENLLTFSRWMCVRARLEEDVVEGAACAGIRQYAILGAGLDSFAYRRPDLLAGLRVFEVDHPASQAWKRERLAELGVDLPANLVFAAVDFERQTLRAGLQAAGFDFTARAVFSWVGVTCISRWPRSRRPWRRWPPARPTAGSCSPTTCHPRRWRARAVRSTAGCRGWSERWASPGSVSSRRPRRRSCCGVAGLGRSTTSGLRRRFA